MLPIHGVLFYDSYVQGKVSFLIGPGWLALCLEEVWSSLKLSSESGLPPQNRVHRVMHSVCLSPSLWYSQKTGHLLTNWFFPFNCRWCQQSERKNIKRQS